MPVALSLGISAIIVILSLDLGAMVIGQNFYASISSFPLLAIPFFILAGVILKKAKLAEKIANLFILIVGSYTGGLAIVAILTSIFWGSLSGSGPATTAAVGLILISSMTSQGYEKHFSAALIATSADISIIIPPSIAFIIYGNLTSTSIGNLFIAGILPGIFMGLCLLLTAYIICRKRQWSGVAVENRSKKFTPALKESAPALLSPVIILGGIYTGIFTPTEASVVAVFYSALISMFFYKTLGLKDIYDSLIETAVLTSVIMFIVSMAGLFSWATSVLGVVDIFSTKILDYARTPFLFIIFVDVIVLALGMILDAISIMYILVPMLVPIIEKYHLHPVWFGVIFVSGLAIGQATPPVGVNLFTAIRLIDGHLDQLSKEAIPFILAAIFALIIISAFPFLSLCLIH